MSKEPNVKIDTAIQKIMKAHNIVGLSACRVQHGEVVWEGGYGWADIEEKKLMTVDVIQNIGSISKTFTNTALMKLWELGLFRLDDPVNEYLPFKVSHPVHKKTISFRQLLTHTSAIADGPSYQTSYACGDPAISLSDWLREYMLPGGQFYSAEENFYPWQPGEKMKYTNVGYGLLGYLVECLAGEPFNRYCRERIFKPLGMDHTGWMLSEIDIGNHATLYAVPEAAQQLAPLFAVETDLNDITAPVPLCLYSFPNYPDGLIRTSACELARYAAAFSMPSGSGIPLKKETMARCFTPETPPQEENGMTRRLGLTWFNLTYPDALQKEIWYHGGSDPGVSTMLQLSLEDNGAILWLSNSNHGLESTVALSNLLWGIG